MTGLVREIAVKRADENLVAELKAALKLAEDGDITAMFLVATSSRGFGRTAFAGAWHEQLVRLIGLSTIALNDLVKEASLPWVDSEDDDSE